MISKAGIFFGLFFTSLLAAQIRVVTTTPDLAWAVSEIGKDQVTVQSLLDGTENPHYVDAVPSYISKVAAAQVVCQVGLDLEVGWMPKVLTRSGNAAVQMGGPGYCDVGSKISVLEKPTGPVDRSLGDIHPMGNPHFWLSPLAMAEAGEAIANSLARVDPVHAADYQGRVDGFKKKLAALRTKLLAEVKRAGLDKIKFMEYHKEFTYFFAAYGLTSAGALEEKPGIPPSAGRLARVALDAKATGVKAALHASYAPRTQFAKFAELSGIPLIELPTSIRVGAHPETYEEFQTLLIQTIEQTLQQAKAKP